MMGAAAMSKTALIGALKTFDLQKVRTLLESTPELRDLPLDRGFNALQLCCSRSTIDDRAAAQRQLKLAQWLVDTGSDPRAIHITAPGEDGEEDSARVSLAWFAVARAQNTRLARYFLSQGADPNAFFAAVWWANHEILPDLAAHGGRINEVVGATPLHMAVDLVRRGVEGKPALARRRLTTIKTMLRLGADPNIAAINGATPLHSVIEKDLGSEVFKLLLQHGADPDVPGAKGRTVRDIAMRKRVRAYADAL